MENITTSFSKGFKGQVFSKNIFLFLLLLFGTVILKKLLPNILFSFFLFTTIIYFYRSKNNGFFILYAATITFDVGGIIGFHGYEILSNLHIQYFEIFSLAAFIKAIRIKPHFFFVKKPFLIWFYFGVFLLFYGYLAFGSNGFGGNTGLRYYWFLIKFLSSFLLFFSLNKLIDYEDILKISEILFVLIFINFFGQLYYLIIGDPIFISIIGEVGGESSFIRSLGENVIQSQVTIRPEFGAIFRFLAYFLSFYFYYNQEKHFNKTYLQIVIITILISTFITATRGWIISFSFILLLTILLTSEGKRFIKPVVIGIIAVFILVTYYKPLRFQFNNALQRFETVELLLHGDPTAGGTNKRLTSRSEPVMAVFKEHPFMGVGISGLGMKTSDLHVGNQTILMGGGVIAMVIFMYFIFYTIFKVFLYNKYLKNKNGYNGILLLIIYNFLGLLIIHSSSSAMFGWLVYALHPEKVFFISLLFVIYNKTLIFTLIKYGYYRKK